MQIVFATNNKNKLEEVQAIIPKHIKLLRLSDIGCTEDIPETQNTIEGNAIQKAEYVTQNYGYHCFADDTGLEAEALHGAPGVFSARYAGAQRNAEDNISKLLSELENKNTRNAQFKTVIAVYLDDKLHTFTGICKGEITTEKHGDKGFGYDSIFKPVGHIQTFAEMDLKIKNRISHRGLAMQKLIAFLETL